MAKERNNGNGARMVRNISGVISVTAVCALMLVMCSCTRTVYEPVESVRTEYRDREVERLVADTVHDTRLVWIKGDTVIHVREKERIRRVEIRDTCYIERNDTIRIPHPVERPLTRWQQAKMDFGGMAIGGTAIALCTALAWLARRFRRH